MHKLYELRDMLMKELNGCTQKDELSPNSLDMIDKLTHSIKSIDTILAMEDYGYDEYKARRRASNGRYMNSYNDNYNRSYNDYYDSYDRSPYMNNMSRRYGHDEAKAELVNRLRSMEMSAENEEQRKMIRHWISQAEEN